MELMPIATKPGGEPIHTRPDGTPYTKDDREFWELERNGGIRRYQHFEFPTMVFRASVGMNGRTEVETTIAQNERHLESLQREGYWRSPDDAKKAAEVAQIAISDAAAEREYDIHKRLVPDSPAQREALAETQATAYHNTDPRAAEEVEEATHKRKGWPKGKPRKPAPEPAA